MRIVPLLSVLLCNAVVFAQTPTPTPAPTQRPQKRRPATTPKIARRGNLPAAPQVVTIVHRLNGLKMFRMLRRSQEPVWSIEALDSAFKLMDDVQTNVIAGLAMDDGTIAAWLPEVDVEFGPPAPVVEPVAPLPPKAPRAPVAAFPRFYDRVFQGPDISVIGPGGRRLEAKYIGLDGVTGLSILKLTQKGALPPSVIKDERVNTGETVLLYGPEPATKPRAVFSNNLYVRMGAIEAQIQDVLNAPSGDVARFKVSSPQLSEANIGGVAVNEAGETIGIVDGLEGTEASILPVALIRRAADRVLEQQASVPRPWLGVKGEAIAALNVNQLQNHGWGMKRASDLAEQHRGILLTSIAPNSPAAKAALRAGDVILKVDDKDILNAEDFTWWLEQAGPSSSVEFTVARPDRPQEEPLNVKLSGMLDRTFTFSLRNRPASARGFSLIDQGIETIALKQPVALQLGTTAGLLVVYVEPFTAAFDAGLEPGDVIQSINGKPVAFFKPTTPAPLFTFDIVRNKQKLVIKVATKKK